MGHIGPYWATAFIVQGVCTLVTAIFVVARLGVRYSLGPDRLGYDDWILLAAWLFTLITSVTGLASFYPMFWGYNVQQYNTPGVVSMDVHYQSEIIFGVSLFFGALAVGLLRAAIAAFLFRLTAVRWHRIVIAIPTAISMAFSIVMAIMYMLTFVQNAKHPFEHPKQLSTYVGYGFFSYTLAMDFFFALFPWAMFHNVNMKKSKKLVICCSLSLGAIAGAFGIAKLYEVFAWTVLIDVMYQRIFQTIEQCILYICVCLPAFLPLWTRYREKRKKKHLDQQGRAGEVMRRGSKKKQGDSIIRDPRLEELLIETVAPGREETVTDNTAVNQESSRDEKLMAESETQASDRTRPPSA